MEENAQTSPSRTTHSTPHSSASRASSTFSTYNILTPTSDSESTATFSVHPITTLMPRSKMALRLSESSLYGSAGDLYQDRDDTPTAKSTYLILHQPTNLALTLVGGKFTLHKVPFMLGDEHSVAGKCNWHWECVETDGWFGFRNAASGRYIGHDGVKKGVGSEQSSGSYLVTAPKHGVFERLVCVRAGCGEQEEGCTAPQQNKRGYILHSLFISETSVKMIEVPRLVKAWAKPHDSTFGSEEGWKKGSEVSMVWQDRQDGTVWRFVKVA